MKKPLTISFLNLGDSLVAILLNFTIINVYGLSTDLDAYFGTFAWTVAYVSLLDWSLTFGVGPLLTRWFRGREDEKYRWLVNSILRFSLAVALLLGAAQWFFADALVSALLPGFQGDGFVIAVDFFATFGLISILRVVSSFIHSLNFSQDKLYIKPWVNIGTKVVQLAYISLFFEVHGIYAILHGMVAAHSLSFCALVFMNRKYYSRSVAFDPSLNPVFHRFFQVFCIGVALKSQEILNRYFTSSLPEGKLSCLAIAERVIQLAYGFASSGLGTVSLRRLSSVEDGRGEEAVNLIKSHLKGMMFVVFPLVFYMTLVGKDALNLVLFTDKIRSADIELVYGLMLMLSGYLVGSSLTVILSSTFYSSGRTRQVMKVELLIGGVRIICQFLSFYYYGLFALVGSISLIALGKLGVYVLLVSRRHPSIPFAQLAAYGLKVGMIAGIPLLLYFFDMQGLDIIPRLGVKTFLYLGAWFSLALWIERDVSRLLWKRLWGVWKL